MFSHENSSDSPCALSSTQEERSQVPDGEVATSSTCRSLVRARSIWPAIGLHETSAFILTEGNTQATQNGQTWQVELPLEARAVKSMPYFRSSDFMGPVRLIGHDGQKLENCTNKFCPPRPIISVRRRAGAKLDFAGAPRPTTRSNGKEVLKSAKHQHVKAPGAWPSKSGLNESWC